MKSNRLLNSNTNITNTINSHNNTYSSSNKLLNLNSSTKLKFQSSKDLKGSKMKSSKTNSDVIIPKFSKNSLVSFLSTDFTTTPEKSNRGERMHKLNTIHEQHHENINDCNDCNDNINILPKFSKNTLYSFLSSEISEKTNRTQKTQRSQLTQPPSQQNTNEKVKFNKVSYNNQQSQRTTRSKVISRLDIRELLDKQAAKEERFQKTIEIERTNFHEVLKTNNLALADRDIYKNLKLKKPKQPYDPNYLQTEVDKKFMFNNNDENVNKTVQMFQNPSLNHKKVVNKNKEEMYKTYRVFN